MVTASSSDRPLAGHFIDYLDQPCGVITPGGRLLQWNEKVCEVTGYNDEELVGMGAVELVPEEEKQLIEEEIQAVLEEGQVTVRAHYLTKDGRQVPYEFQAARQRMDGRTLIFAAGREITEFEPSRKVPHEFDALLQNALDPLPVYLFTQDLNYRYLWFSSLVPGLESDNFVGKRDVDLYSEEDVRGLREVKDRVIETSGP